MVKSEQHTEAWGISDRTVSEICDLPLEWVSQYKGRIDYDVSID